MPLKTENPLILSNKFNAFYSSVGKITADKAMQLAKQQGFSTSSRNLSCSRANNVHEKCPVTESQVEKIVQGLPRNKAPGMDKITSRVLKVLLPVSLPIITSLFNKSFATGSLVRSWKMTKVIPILRSGDFEVPVINRSISLLPMLSKV